VDVTSFPENRPLTAREAAIIAWLLEHGNSSAAEYLQQLDKVRVVSRCSCGCASVNFSIDGVIPPSENGMGILSDYQFLTNEGHLCGVFVFEQAGLLAGLEVWSIDGLTKRPTLPIIEQLQPLGSVAPPPNTPPDPSL